MRSKKFVPCLSRIWPRDEGGHFLLALSEIDSQKSAHFVNHFWPRIICDWSLSLRDPHVHLILAKKYEINDGGTVLAYSGSIDFDGDGIMDYADDDDDNDGIPDILDKDDDNDGIPDTIDKDDDNDGILDEDDNWGQHLLKDIDDQDGDGVDDKIDNDDDNDGIPDDEDDDDDNDGIPDAQDNDDDNDGIPDNIDNDSDGDGIPDDKDNDDDGDGIPDSKDKDDDGDGIPDAAEDGDTDGDGILDAEDDDDDNDGILDDDEELDTDGDGVPDSVDLDDDNDGIYDDVDDDDNNNGIPDHLDFTGSLKCEVKVVQLSGFVSSVLPNLFAVNLTRCVPDIHGSWFNSVLCLFQANVAFGPLVSVMVLHGLHSSSCLCHWCFWSATVSLRRSFIRKKKSMMRKRKKKRPKLWKPQLKEYQHSHSFSRSSQGRRTISLVLALI